MLARFIGNTYFFHIILMSLPWSGSRKFRSGMQENKKCHEETC